jgi:hypothetical protein
MMGAMPAIEFSTLAARDLRDVTKAQLQDVKSLDFCRWLACYGEARSRELAHEWYLARYPRSYAAAIAKKELEGLRNNDVELMAKAAVPIGTTTDPNFAGNLVGLDGLLAAFTERVAAQSLLGRLEAAGARKIPFNAKAPFETTGAVYQWVAEAAPTPVSAMAFGAGATLKPLKSASLLVFTLEFIRGISDATADSLRRTLSAGLIAFSDAWLLSTNAASAAAPAGLLAGVTPVASTGNLQADMLALNAAFFSARPWASAPVTIASPANAMAIVGASSGGGNATTAVMPLLVTPAAGPNIVLLDAEALVYADGGITIDISTQGTLQMNDAPGVPDATTVFTSLWEQNLVGFKVARVANWAIAPGAVQYLLPGA